MIHLLNFFLESHLVTGFVEVQCLHQDLVAVCVRHFGVFLNKQQR